MIDPYYSDDHVTIYHGDCLDLLPLIDADVVVTDPPYGIGHTRAKEHYHAIYGDGQATGVGGRQTADRVITRNETRVRDLALAATGSAPKLVFGSWRAPRPRGTMGRLIWDKQITGVGFWGAWKPTDEEIYLINWPNPRTEQGNEPNIIRIASAVRGSDRFGHPTPKPVALMSYLIQRCPPGVILDPFVGSGSTLRAAKDLGRKAIGIEIDERYCEIAARRCAQEVLPLGL